MRKGTVVFLFLKCIGKLKELAMIQLSVNVDTKMLKYDL